MNMDLEQQINDDIKKAMLSKDSKRLEALRAVKAAILLLKSEKGGREAGISEEAALKTLQKLVKQRRESAEIFAGKGRNDLADSELFQAKVIEAYLPEQLSEEEIRKNVEKIIEETGATDMKDMGKVMGMASKQMAGKADNKIISTIVRDILGS